MIQDWSPIPTENIFYWEKRWEVSGIQFKRKRRRKEKSKLFY